MKKKAIHMKFLNHSIGFCLLLTLLCYSAPATIWIPPLPIRYLLPIYANDEAYAAYAVSGLEKLMKIHLPH